MARAPTRFSRVSIGWVDSAKSIIDVDAGDTGAVFSVVGNSVFSGTQTVSGAQTFTGAATFSSTVSSAGTVTAIGGVLTGSGVKTALLSHIKSSVISVDVGSVPGHDSASSAYSFTGSAVGDVVLLTPDSIWSGAYFDLSLFGTVLAANEVVVAAANSAVTAVDPAAMNFRISLLRFV